MSQSPVIHWFRRDLRLRDNVALHNACARGAPVIPLFIIDPTLMNSKYVGAARVKFLLDALHSLDKSLQVYGARLLIRRGKPEQVLPPLVAETGAQTVYFNRGYSPYARLRDERVERSLTIPVSVFDDAVLMPPGSILKDDGKPYVVYTPFWKKWKTLDKPRESEHRYQMASFFDVSKLPNDNIPSLAKLGFSDTRIHIEATENAVLNLLNNFTHHDIKRYSEQRNWLPINPFSSTRPTGTSYLSPYLRLGLLSPRQAYWAARTAYQIATSQSEKESIETWVSELAWREFYVHILYHFPHVLQRDFVDTFQTLAWRNAPDDLQAWQVGKTGYPIIDAPMRQLRAIGWMPNRARMIVASFLTKDLLIHWKHGEKHFMQHLLDGDPAANNGGWQWAAGTGTDAQPYFRIFNPVSQSQKFATAAYLKHWLPELRDVPEGYIHEPWTAPTPPQAYPAPIVEHSFARERALNAFKVARAE
jgi:deoxyribodipyrimidine photo-lyase